MRRIPLDFDPAIVAAIDARLDGIVADGVAITLAVESGSRAWGFASPDSDYDCRFIYVRRAPAYLSLWPERDVIETPIDGLLDVSGWDVGKALKLIVKGNAVAIEWLRSPIIYRGDPAFRRHLVEFAAEHAPVAAVQRHYLHLARQQWAMWTTERQIKKAFYALRPAMALRWMERHTGALPPMHFPTLVDESDVPPAARGAIDELLAAKARTRELGVASMPDAIAHLINDEIDRAGRNAVGEVDDRGARAAADRLFRTIVADFAPG